MESSIFVSAPFKGVFWHFKVDRRIYLTDTVGVKNITSDPPQVDINEAYFLFPHVTFGSLDRPVQSVGMLIGYDKLDCCLLVEMLKMVNVWMGYVA